MRRIAKRDRNHAQIVNALRDVGYTVLDLANVGAGCPDIAVGGIDARTGRRMNWFMEIKMPDGALTDDQIAFHGAWRGVVHVVDSVDAAYKVIGILP